MGLRVVVDGWTGGAGCDSQQTGWAVVGYLQLVGSDGVDGSGCFQNQ